MARTRPAKQLSQAEMDRCMIEAERLHMSIVQPLLSPGYDHYRSLQAVHEVLLRSIKEITGRDASFIRWNLTGPAKRSGQ